MDAERNTTAVHCSSNTLMIVGKKMRDIDMIEFVEYSDDKINIKLPKQLRQQRSQRLFRGNLVRGKPESNLMVAISLDLNASGVKAVRDVFLGARINRPETLPKGYKVERSGKCCFGEGCLELFTSSEIFDKGYTLYTWQVLYRLQGSYVELSIMGGGSRESFESMAEEIITSLKLMPPSQSKKTSSVSTGSKIKNIKHGGLNVKEKTRLTNALKSFPEDLRYLQEPILAIADEDQDLLGCGEVDTTLLVKAIEQQAVSQHSGFATKQSKKLEKWLKTNTSKKDTWAGPAWFAMAFLMGYDLFYNKQQM